MTDPKVSFWDKARRLDARGAVGVVADLATVGTVLYAAVSIAMNETLQSAILAIALAAITVVCLGIVWRLEVALRRKDAHALNRERVSRATPGLAAAIADLSRATTALNTADNSAPRSFVQHCESACKEFARALQALTGVDCRVTLQEVYVPVERSDDAPAVKVVATSYGLPSNNKGVGGVDLVRDNSDFESLFLHLEELFLCNDLPEAISAGYRNSHWTPEKLAEWRRTGAYPYRSTAVWPLRGITEGATGDADPVWDVAGFLSVDAKYPDTFDGDTTKPLGDAFAHAAYSGLVMYRLVKEEDLWHE